MTHIQQQKIFKQFLLYNNNGIYNDKLDEFYLIFRIFEYFLKKKVVVFLQSRIVMNQIYLSLQFINDFFIGFISFNNYLYL